MNEGMNRWTDRWMDGWMDGVTCLLQPILRQPGTTVMRRCGALVAQDETSVGYPIQM